MRSSPGVRGEHGSNDSDRDIKCSRLRKVKRGDKAVDRSG